MEKASQEDLEELILEQKRLVAEGYFFDAWERALNDGIDGGIIARALVRGALTQIARISGDEEATQIIAEINQLEVEGDFLPTKTIQ